MSKEDTCRKGHNEWYERPDGRRECAVCARARENRKYQNNPDFRERKKASVKKYYQENKESVLAYHREYHYDLSEEDYKTLLEDQGGVCAICQGGPKTYDNLSVDHDHDTGEVRGLLCSRCNLGLGHFNHDPQLFQRCIEYLG